MERLLTYTITHTENGQSVKEYLKAEGFSTQNLIRLKESENSILQNQVPVFVNSILHTGDILQIRIPEETSSENIKPVDLPFTILYEDEDLLVVDKPAGMPTHPSVNNYDNSLANGLAYYFAKQNLPFVFRCVNRLDKDTSGLTLIAKHSVSAGILGRDVANKDHFQREYLAISKGYVTPKRGTIDVPIARKPGSVIERTVDYEKGESAITHYEVLEEKNGHSLLSIHLETGRTHQIRVHMKYLGYPLIGDHLYYPDTERITRHALHSHRLVFQHPITKEKMDFVSPLPRDMEQAFYQTL